MAVPGDPAPAGHHLRQLALSALERLVDRAERLVDRLRSLSEARLARRSGDGPSVADSAHALAQLLADLAADLEGRVRREVPRLDNLAVGDQVAVTLHDLVAAAGNDSAESGVAVGVAMAGVQAVRDQIEGSSS